ncbi:MAG: glycosyltransferase family 4 protein [Nitrospirae bacterium]|nr:glycosyltransferase family 4 protein [Nitrospirota bacterium]
MKILVLSFYFRPDLSAGSFRTTALVDALCKLVPADAQIDVITTLPNRYHSYTADAPLLEQKAGMFISRITLPKHQSGLLDQSKAFLTFSRGAGRQVAGQHYDIIFATSSRLMTAVLGAWFAQRMSAKLYLDIRDIFADTIKDLLPRKVSWIVTPIFSMLEKWAIKKADKVNLVSAGFSEYFSARYPQRRFSYFTNGIDDEFLAAAPNQLSEPSNVAEDRPFTVLYAGNMGDGQGLHAIIPDLAGRMGARVQFKIIGDGGRRRALETALSERGVVNVELLPPLKRDSLLEAYKTADVLFLHLNDYNAFKKVLPSKLFEYAALGKPVWAGVAGYAAEFVKSEIDNSAVFHPCDVEDAVSSFDKLIIKNSPRNAFVDKYARVNISRQMAEDILAVAAGKQ